MENEEKIIKMQAGMLDGKHRMQLSGEWKKQP